MRAILFITLCLIGLVSSGFGAVLDLGSSSIQFLGRTPRSYEQNDYRTEGSWWNYHFSFTNRSRDSLYFYVHRNDVPDIAGQPFYYEQSWRWGRWSDPTYQLRDVRMVFRRVRAGETVRFHVSREPSFWPCRVSFRFYQKPEYHAATELVLCPATLK